MKRFKPTTLLRDRAAESRRYFIQALLAGTLLPVITAGKPVQSSEKAPLARNSWITVKGKVYGARPDKQGPIGGGAGYQHIITRGDYQVADLDSLVAALAKATPGQTVFIAPDAEIDLTTLIYVEKFVLEIPEGVTLASNRGYRGSKGALLISDSLNTPKMVQVTGPNVRITGLRLQGPNPKRYLEHHRKAFGPGGEGNAYYYKFPVSRGIQVAGKHFEMDNCEISACSHAGVFLEDGDNHHIHHNFIHHCQYNGLGYGIAHKKASSLIEYNQFDSNRHSIAGTGEPGCGYTARHNIELGTSLSHCFDMHGGKDRKDGTNIAGTTIEIYNNTFYPPQAAIGIRGNPLNKAEVYQNWFAGQGEQNKAVNLYNFTKTRVLDNVYGSKASFPR